MTSEEISRRIEVARTELERLEAEAAEAVDAPTIASAQTLKSKPKPDPGPASAADYSGTIDWRAIKREGGQAAVTKALNEMWAAPIVPQERSK